MINGSSKTTLTGKELRYLRKAFQVAKKMG